MAEPVISKTAISAPEGAELPPLDAFLPTSGRWTTPIAIRAMHDYARAALAARPAPAEGDVPDANKDFGDPRRAMDETELQEFCIALSFEQDDYTTEVIRAVESRMLAKPLFFPAAHANVQPKGTEDAAHALLAILERAGGGATVADVLDRLSNPSPAPAPIGYLARNRLMVADALKFEHGCDPAYLWRYTHGTQNMEALERIDALEVLRVYAAIPAPAPAPEPVPEGVRDTIGKLLAFGKGHAATLGWPPVAEYVALETWLKGIEFAAAKRDNEVQGLRATRARGQIVERALCDIMAMTTVEELDDALWPIDDYVTPGLQAAYDLKRAAVQAPAPAPLTVPGGPEWLLPGDIAVRIAYEHPGTVTAGVVQSVAKAVHQLRAATQAPAVAEQEQAALSDAKIVRTFMELEGATTIKTFNDFDAIRFARAIERHHSITAASRTTVQGSQP